MGIKISELPLGTAEQNAVVPSTNATATQTTKITLASIASLATKQTVGLGNVDNTSDLNKPVSVAQADADTAVATSAATDATTKANAAQTYAIQRSNHTGTQAIGTIDGLQSALDAKQNVGNYAILVDEKIPSSQLPSYVDDVLEFANFESLPAMGESGKIYVTLDYNKTYRWSGSVYVEISASPGSTDAVPEGGVNKYYTDSRASSAAPVQSVSGRTGAITLSKNDVDLGSVDNTSDVNKPISSATQTALNTKAPISSPVLSLGAVSGSTSINFGSDRLIQTLSLNGTTTTFNKGTGWPVGDTSVDVMLRITATSATTIVWSIVTDWFNQPTGALAVGTHLVLLRSIGSSIIEGHYIGIKTN